MKISLNEIIQLVNIILKFGRSGLSESQAGYQRNRDQV